ncbi:MAG: hypothetical protein ACJ72N_19835 [Labedaea sp.]
MTNPLEPTRRQLDAIPAGPVVEAKVKTSAVASAAAAGVLSLLSIYVFHGGQVPSGLAVTVTTVVVTVVSGLVTFAVGWLTKHTPRSLLTIDTEE